MLEGSAFRAPSIRYAPHERALLLRSAGWVPTAEWVDPQGLFSLILAEAAPEPTAP